MNYHKIMLKEIAKIEKQDKRPNLLIHSCCGPCSTYVIDFLSKYFDITIYYYNPNIYPQEEYIKRELEQEKFINQYSDKINFIKGTYNQNDFDVAVKGLEHLGEKSKRCYNCYQFRLESSAKKAKELNFDYFTSTISISKHKNVEFLTDIGENLEKKHGVKYLYSDFKKNNGYSNSIKLSKEYDLYRQDYCGCIYSLNEKGVKN